MRRTEMTTLMEILRRRHDGGLTIREIAAATVRQVLRKADDVGIGWPLSAGMGEAELYAAIYPSSVRAPVRDRLQPDWPTLVSELGVSGRRRARVTRYLLWREYCTEATDRGLKPYGRTQFDALLGEYLSGQGAGRDAVCVSARGVRLIGFLRQDPGGDSACGDTGRGDLRARPGLFAADLRCCGRGPDAPLVDGCPRSRLRLLRRHTGEAGDRQSEVRGYPMVQRRAGAEPDLCRVRAPPNRLPVLPARRGHARDDVARYVADLRQRRGPRGERVIALDSGAGLSNATIQQRLSAVRLFFDFLMEEGLCDTNRVGRGRYTPAKGFGAKTTHGLVRRHKRLPWIPSDEQWRRFLGQDRDELLRNRCMLALAYDAALRREELCALESGDSQPAHRLLRVRAETSKSGQDRVVPYSETGGVLLAAYLARGPAIPPAAQAATAAWGGFRQACLLRVAWVILATAASASSSGPRSTRPVGEPRTRSRLSEDGNPIRPDPTRGVDVNSHR